MTRNHGATKTCRYGNNGSVSAYAAAGGLTCRGADGVDRASNFQARKRRPRGVLSTLIPRVPGRRLEAMNAHAKAQPEDTLSIETYQHFSPLVGVKHSVRRHEPDSGGGPPAWGREATAGKPGRGDG
jgi:hypothetical protein